MSRDNIKQDRSWFAVDLPILYWDFFRNTILNRISCQGQNKAAVLIEKSKTTKSFGLFTQHQEKPGEYFQLTLQVT